MFFAIFLELYSNSRYNKGRGVSAIIRYLKKSYLELINVLLRHRVSNYTKYEINCMIKFLDTSEIRILVSYTKNL